MRTQNDDIPPGKGAVYVFERHDDGTWLELGTIVPDDVTDKLR